jgi:hypothetical protein
MGAAFRRSTPTRLLYLFHPNWNGPDAASTSVVSAVVQRLEQSDAPDKRYTFAVENSVLHGGSKVANHVDRDRKSAKSSSST